MKTQQIYSIINTLNGQMTGALDITVVDTSTFVSYGDAVLSSSDATEGFLNVLCMQIYKDIVEGRAYKSHMKNYIKDTATFGAIVRKISVDMPDLVEEKAIELKDGDSVDQWEVKLPVAEQHLFASRTPYSAFITIQRRWLREAFKSEGNMETFIASVFMKVQNKLELSIENLAKSALNNYAGLAKATQTINLVTMYNAETESELETGIKALHNPDFMRYAVGVIKETMVQFNTMSKLYNYDGKERFTPYANQELAILGKFKTQLETVALYGAFNDEYINLAHKTLIPYWQGSGKNAPLDFASYAKIAVKVRTPKSEEIKDVTLTNVVAMLHDTNAVGAYRQMEDVLTTPVNARGMYYNTFWHEQQSWFNQTDENFVVFTLN